MRTPSGMSRLAGLVAFMLILVAAVALQADALRLPFFADDYLFLDQVRDRSLPAVLASGDPLGNFFRPIGRQVHFWWIAAVSGESPVAFHFANVAAFALIVALVFALVQRLAGLRAAVVAAALLALHHTADVPVRWASGSQDLLAVAGALTALFLHLTGLRWFAAAALLAALLSKETVALTPLIAVMAGRRPGEAWSAAGRRAWPLFAAAGVWALMWLSAAGRLAGAEKTVEVNPAGLPAALVHFLQTLLGVEWAAGGSPVLPAPPALVPLVLALVALAVAWRGSGAATPRAWPSRAPHPVRLGLVWALLGALPVAAVSSIWSAYYYLFALCGAGLAIGALAARGPVAVAVAIVALFAWGSQSGRGLREFSTRPDPWNTQSHVNRFYMERSMAFVSRYLDDLERQRPTLPERSTVFFSGLPGFVAFQSADGPVVRWAYRDSSLRSYYLTAFTLERARRGPVFSFVADQDTLREDTLGEGAWKTLALGMLLDGKAEAARDALVLELEANPEDAQARYWYGFVLHALGDTAAARELSAAGVALRPGPTPETLRALRQIAAGDTLGARQTIAQGVAGHALDPGAHALLADISLAGETTAFQGYFEAWAATQVGPGDPANWRRWGMVLMRARRYPQAVSAFEYYREIGGAAARDDAQVRRWLVQLERRLPGGDVVARDLRRLPGETP